MNQIDRTKIIKMVCSLSGICIGVGLLSKIVSSNQESLIDYANQNPDIAYAVSAEITEAPKNTIADQSATSTISSAETPVETPSETLPTNTIAPTEIANGNNVSSADSNEDLPKSISENTSNPEADAMQTKQTIIGTKLNTDALDSRITYQDGFYQEEISDDLLSYITGKSFPLPENQDSSIVTVEELRFLHVQYINFEGIEAEGELICNEAIATDLLEIFYELYQNDYQIESINLVDYYQADDDLSMDANNSSCFNYRFVAGTQTVSKHSMGLAIDINPLYNPYVTYEKNGELHISPLAGSAYVNRSEIFPYKIDENDLCYKLFMQHGFTWGGNWNSAKDYQHFQKKL